jgi:hypothetical protein
MSETDPLWQSILDAAPASLVAEEVGQHVNDLVAAMVIYPLLLNPAIRRAAIRSALEISGDGANAVVGAMRLIAFGRALLEGYSQPGNVLDPAAINGLVERALQAGIGIAQANHTANQGGSAKT